MANPGDIFNVLGNVGISGSVSFTSGPGESYIALGFYGDCTNGGGVPLVSVVVVSGENSGSSSRNSPLASVGIGISNRDEITVNNLLDAGAVVGVCLMRIK